MMHDTSDDDTGDLTGGRSDTERTGRRSREREQMLRDLDATDDGYDSRTVVVGITPKRPERVIETALQWARVGIIHRIAFIYVDSTLTATDGRGDSLDSDDSDRRRSAQSKALADRMASIIHSYGVHASFTRLGGDAATRLADEARRIGASAIIVGTRERGPLAAVSEWVRGSVSVHLEHIQNIPVVVIPLGEHESGAGQTEPHDGSNNVQQTRATASVADNAGGAQQA